jgi:H+-transporting ATPase
MTKVTKNKNQSNNSLDENLGLSTEEANKRLLKDGKNVISEKQIPEILLLLHKFWGVIPWMLEASILINLIIKKWADAILIAVLLIFQALLGFYQERNGKRAIALLKQKLNIFVQVKRDGEWKKIPASEIVVGDLIHLQGGDIIPADIKILKGVIFVDQSQLTGESMTVEVKEGQTAYAGSLVTQGEADALVEAVGDKTYYGKTASLVRLAEKPPLLQRLALNISKYLLTIDIILALITIITMVHLGVSIITIFTFVLMLLVLSVPVALPAMSTLSATVGVGNLAKMGILTTHLSAIENAAAMDVFCVDKTGTLTENKPQIKTIISFSPYSENEILYYAARGSDTASSDPLTVALLNKAKEQNLLKEDTKSQIIFEPFNPETKTSGAVIIENGKQVYLVKAEPQAGAKLAKIDWSKISESVEELSKNGDRVIAILIDNDGSGLKLAGLISLTDPIRNDSKELIKTIQSKGIKIKMLTGDGKSTAESVAKQVGIQGLTAPDDINYEKLTAEEAEKYDIFPRVLPQDKYFIVKALQKNGHVVGMTGDGVNDAPALRQADVGIATSNATEVAKSSADLILTQPGLINIPQVIMVSRNIHQRMKTWISAMITRKAAIPTFVSLGVLIFKEPVITPSLAFIFMFLGDIVTFSLSKDNVMPSSKPDRWNMKQLVIFGSFNALIMFLMSLLVFWIPRHIFGLSLAQTQTLVFAWLVLVGGQASLYLVRTRTVFWAKPYPGRWFIVATIFTVILTIILATFGIFMKPISFSWMMILILGAFIYLLLGNLMFLALKKVISNKQ